MQKNYMTFIKSPSYIFQEAILKSNMA